MTFKGELEGTGVFFAPNNDSRPLQFIPKGMTKLDHLSIASAQITDAGLVHLVGLKDLEHLDLSSNKITDRALAQLSQMRKLRWLDLHQTHMTEEGIRQLKRALPNAHIQFSRWDVPQSFQRR